MRRWRDGAGATVTASRVGVTRSGGAAFLDQGVRSVTDLGGQPLAFPDSLFNVTSPPIRFASTFTSTEAAIIS